MFGENKLDTVNSLFGSVPDTMTLEDAREERLNGLWIRLSGQGDRLSAKQADKNINLDKTFPLMYNSGKKQENLTKN